MKTNIINNIKAIILSIFIVAGVSYVYAAGTWTPPNCTPPGCNTEEPINVGSNPQTKTGDLTIDKTIKTKDLVVKTDTAPTVGQMLTAADTDGKVKWANVSTGGSAGGIKTIIGPIEGTGTVNDKSGDFELLSESDVLVYAYANTMVGGGDKQKINFFVNNTFLKTLWFGEACQNGCSGSAGSVTFTTRLKLPKGTHNLRVTTGGAVQFAHDQFANKGSDGGLQFIVYVLN